MEMFSPEGIILVLVMSVLSVLFVAVLVGKFFYVAPFRNWYDEMKEAHLPLILGIVGTISVILIWVGSAFGWVTLTMFTTVIALGAWVCLLVIIIIFLGCEIVPFMQKLHNKIIAKRTGK